MLHTNGSLEVSNVQLDDTGDYICEVTVGGRAITQVHSIEVQGKLSMLLPAIESIID
jgi:hypothetical protein